MTIRKRWIFLSFAAIVIILLAVWVNSGFFVNAVLGIASEKTGRRIETTNRMDIDWGWPVTTLHARNITLSNFNNGTAPVMLNVDRLKMSIHWGSLLRGHVMLPEVILDKPKLLLEKDKDGRANWNLTSNTTSAASVDMVTPDDRSDLPVIGELAIHDGTLLYKDPTKRTDIELFVETASGGTPPDRKISFRGKGRYQDYDFKMQVEGGNVFQLKETDKPYPLKIDLKAGDTRAVADGTVLDPVQLKGLDVDLTLQGRDASELFTLVGIALPPTPAYDVTGRLNYRDDKWEFNNFSGRMGSSDLRGSVTWDTGRERPLLSGEFISNKLNFNDLGGFVGAKTSSARPSEKASEERSPYVIPDTPLDISRLASMDAQVTFTGKKLISDALPMDDFYMKVDLDNSLLKVDPVRFGTAKGDITTHLTVNARQEPVKIDGEFLFRKLQLKPIFEKAAQALGTKNVSEGYLGGAAKLSGTGKSLRQMLSTAEGEVVLGMEGGKLSNLIVELLGLDVAQSLGFLLQGDQPVPIRCLIGDFTVDNGMMRVRRFVLDTTDTNIMGKGRINLKNEEMDMTLNAYPKDTSLVSVNSPIRVKGTMKDPDINVNLKNIVGRGAAAAAVGTVVIPVVGLVAFIEPGMGKDSNCYAMIQDIDRKTRKMGDTKVIPKNQDQPASAQ